MLSKKHLKGLIDCETEFRRGTDKILEGHLETVNEKINLLAEYLGLSFEPNQAPRRDIVLRPLAKKDPSPRCGDRPCIEK